VRRRKEGEDRMKEEVDRLTKILGTKEQEISKLAEKNKIEGIE
jgi:hypothetical protein